MKLKHKKERKLNQKSKKQMNKLQKGITLIALVITIIVLLILAGVSIATLTGDNGILTKAQTAKEETEKASDEEQRQLAMLNATMSTKKYDYTTGETDEKGQQITVPIPTGFAPTQIEGENSVKDGFVITDENGNEFVWIPVAEGTEYKRDKSYTKEDVVLAAHDDEGYLPDGITEEAETVKNARGFYIGRYEAGAEGGKLKETINEEGKVSYATWEEDATLVCKEGATVYNWVNKEYAKKRAKTFINNSEVKSALISSIQWDVVMGFVNQKPDGNNKKFDVTQMDESRHTGSLAKSGQNEADRVCNIYDLEGNCLEYIAEKCDFDPSKPLVKRGGYFIFNDSGPASYYILSSISTGEAMSFRFVLYIL